MEKEDLFRIRFCYIRRDPSPDGCRDQDDSRPSRSFTGEQRPLFKTVWQLEEDRQVPFRADECTFTRTVRRMTRLGWEVERVQSLGLEGAPDEKGVRTAQDRGAGLVTTDKGFGDV